MLNKRLWHLVAGTRGGVNRAKRPRCGSPSAGAVSDAWAALIARTACSSAVWQMADTFIPEATRSLDAAAKFLHGHAETAPAEVPQRVREMSQ